jgi:hypothetical protein
MSQKLHLLRRKHQSLHAASIGLAPPRSFTFLTLSSRSNMSVPVLMHVGQDAGRKASRARFTSMRSLPVDSLCQKSVSFTQKATHLTFGSYQSACDWTILAFATHDGLIWHLSNCVSSGHLLSAAGRVHTRYHELRHLENWRHELLADCRRRAWGSAAQSACVSRLIDQECLLV